VEIVKTDIRNLTKDEIKTYLVEMGESAFRAKQIYSWLWQKSAKSFEEMTNLSKELRDALNTQFVINAIKEDVTQKSIDGTVKTRFQLHDGHFMESVLIPVVADNRFTVCVSSQVGCSLSCKFCATGQMKRLRNLDAGEIYDQVVMINRVCEEMYGYPLTNIVYMGMGEPLLAYKNVMQSIHHITSEEGLHMSPRRITISTAGIAKMIKKLADDASKVNLAISLHAADDLKRDEIMPINEQNNLEAIMDSLNYYYQTTRNRISYEYIAFQNFNDSIEDAKNLVKLCSQFPVRVNIIEYNPIDGADFVKADADKIDKFAQYLKDHGVMATIRRSRGKDIDAACGQLANKA
jgi:23S rRNA (adenine2503-C2)-methyltransferase